MTSTQGDSPLVIAYVLAAGYSGSTLPPASAASSTSAGVSALCEVLGARRNGY